jgi:hypothetical protein
MPSEQNRSQSVNLGADSSGVEKNSQNSPLLACPAAGFKLG